MYRRYYDLKLDPFKIEPDPEFLWLGEKHEEGLATLQYGILENKGFLLLTGDVGTGKTVLIHHLRQNLPSQVKVTTIQDPGIEVLDLYRILSADFQIGGRFEGKANFLIHFKRFVAGAYAAQQQLLIIIDEAHRLSCELLDEIRVLSNIDYENRKLINIFFVGQNEFERTLMDRRNQAVRQRIAVSYHLSPLDKQETPAYVRHRLKIAGSDKDFFTPEAFHEIHRLSGGTPRLINVICDRALMTGYVKGVHHIGAETIRECGTELDISLGIPASAFGSDFRSPDHVEKKPSAELSAPSVERPAFSAPPPAAPVGLEKLPGRHHRWLLAALVGLLGVLLYVSFTFRPFSNTRQPDSAVAVGESTGSRHAATAKGPAEGQAPTRSEGSAAGRTGPFSDPKDATQAALPPAPAAIAPKEEIDRPAAVARKPDSGEKMPAAESGLKPAGGNSKAAGTQYAAEEAPPELASASPGAALQVQKFYLLFKSGSAELDDGSFDVLRQVSQLLSAYPYSRITLALFFDPTAKSGYTSKLLALRANCVKSFLTSRGVEARLTVVGRSAESLPGTSRPPVTGDLGSWSEIRIESGNEG